MSELLKVVTCSAQATAQLTAEVSDYDAKVWDFFTFLSVFLYYLL